MRKIVLFLLVAVIIFCGFGGLATATIDKWGGDDRVCDPNSKYQTGTATGVDYWTLTDTSKNWIINELSGLILQPDVNVEVYFLIKSNTQNILTVYGSDIDGNEEECHRHISDENDGNEEYAILNRWTVNKVDDRWSLFNPFGNIFFIKSLNNLISDARFGSDSSGIEMMTNLMNKYGLDNFHHAKAEEIDIIKNVGLNALGSETDSGYIVPGHYSGNPSLTTDRYLPFIGMIRVSALTLPNTNTFTVNSQVIYDAHDNDFQGDIQDRLLIEGGARTSGIMSYDGAGTDSRKSWQSDGRLISPYEKAKYSIAANPYYLGFDWDEEPRYLVSENGNEHMGYRIITSENHTARKKAAINWLQNNSDTLGRGNYGIGASGITALNNAWGSNFSDWSDLQSSTTSVIDPLLSSEPYCRDYGVENEDNTLMKSDLDGIAENFWRTYTKKVHDALDNTTTYHMLNFGPGYHGWSGDNRYDFDGITSPEYLFRGSVSEDGSVPYLDIIAIGDPMHGYHEDTNDIFEYVRNDLKNRYIFHQRPYYHESCWITAEADSGITHTGAVTNVTSTTLEDNTKIFNTEDYWENAYCGARYGGNWIWIINPAETGLDRHIYAINDSCLSETEPSNTFTVFREINFTQASWNSVPNLLNSFDITDNYSIITHDAITHLHAGNWNLYIPRTQEDRASFYVQFITDLINLQADNGDYIDIGYSHWSWWDFSFRNTCTEFRNFGFETARGNLYDGVEATIANGETQDCGDFVTPVSAKLNNIYDEISGGSDTTPPTRSNPEPTGTLSSGTTTSNISLTTNMQAICRYSNVSGTNYTDMTGSFTCTNSTNHSTQVSRLEKGQIYIFYVRCNSTEGYVNVDDFNITFSINGHRADLNDDGIINMPELIAFIARWKTGDRVSRAGVEEVRGIWFIGGVY